MKKIIVLATAGAGGDLQPLLAVALGLRDVVMHSSSSATRRWRRP